jgi:hypothetical protein
LVALSVALLAEVLTEEGYTEMTFTKEALLLVVLVASECTSKDLIYHAAQVALELMNTVLLVVLMAPEVLE